MEAGGCYSDVSTVKITILDSIPRPKIINATLNCDRESADLKTLVKSTTCTDCSLEFHTDNNTNISTYTSGVVAKAGTYYAFYKNSKTLCYSESAKISVEIKNNIPKPEVVNTTLNCDKENIDLRTLVKSTTCADCYLEFHTENNTNISTYTSGVLAKAGTYYAFYGNKTLCYSEGGKIVVTQNSNNQKAPTTVGLSTCAGDKIDIRTAVTSKTATDGQFEY